MQGIIAVNGKISPPSEACISALDRGLLFGDNVFEVFVGFRAHILDIAPHLERLQASADELGIAIPWSVEELSFELRSVAEQLAAPKYYLRLVVTRGNGLGLEIPSDLTPNRIIYGFPAKALDAKIYGEGLSAKLKKLPYTERKPMAKTGNYLRSILALRQANAEGFQDVLWANSEGELTEATTANVFFIGRQGDGVEIVTPSTQSGILQGITRSNILRLLAMANIPAREQIIYADEIPRFDEAFLCSTVRGLVPLQRIDRHAYHSARPKSIFRQIERLFLTWVETEIGYRVDWNSGATVVT